EKERLAVVPAHNLGEPLYPDHVAVLGHEPVLRPEGFAFGTGRGKLRVPAVAVVRVQLAVPQDRIFQPLLLREAKHLLDLRADIELRYAFVERGHKGTRWDVLHQGPELRLLALAIRLFALADSDVSDRGGDERAVLCRQGAEADLD